jgi:hypothetical protein
MLDGSSDDFLRKMARRGERGPSPCHAEKIRRYREVRATRRARAGGRFAAVPRCGRGSCRSLRRARGEQGCPAPPSVPRHGDRGRGRNARPGRGNDRPAARAVRARGRYERDGSPIARAAAPRRARRPGSPSRGAAETAPAARCRRGRASRQDAKCAPAWSAEPLSRDARKSWPWRTLARFARPG